MDNFFSPFSSILHVFDPAARRVPRGLPTVMAAATAKNDAWGWDSGYRSQELPFSVSQAETEHTTIAERMVEGQQSVQHSSDEDVLGIKTAREPISSGLAQPTQASPLELPFRPMPQIGIEETDKAPNSLASRSNHEELLYQLVKLNASDRRSISSYPLETADNSLSSARIA